LQALHQTLYWKQPLIRLRGRRGHFRSQSESRSKETSWVFLYKPLLASTGLLYWKCTVCKLTGTVWSLETTGSQRDVYNQQLCMTEKRKSISPLLQRQGSSEKQQCLCHCSFSHKSHQNTRQNVEPREINLLVPLSPRR
jgi:hypothetical protein